MSTKGVQVFDNLKAPDVPGDYHRIVCMTGKLKGHVYILHGNRLILGRDEKCDIYVEDERSSREHAELVLMNGKYILTDLKSQNGIVVNDLKINQHTLDIGDKIIIGKTVYRYDHLHIEPLPVLVEEIDEVKNLEIKQEEELKREKRRKRRAKSKTKLTSSGGVDKKKLIIRLGMLLGILALVFAPSDDQNSQKKKIEEVKTKTSKDEEKKKDDTDKKYEEYVKNYRPIEDPELEARLVAIIHRGNRDFRERNFYRAMKEFSLALIISPDHAYASFYLAKAQDELLREVDQFKLKASSDSESLRYESAIISYCAIIKLLEDNPENEDYKQAKEKINKLEVMLGKKKNETKCIKKEEVNK
ncbi:MAG: FHA domain-containing protein [Halobacteriovoraceae bacterium]|nr:FHA domain-containing protein [Halobacteriovoraceae bacterium]